MVQETGTESKYRYIQSRDSSTCKYEPEVTYLLVKPEVKGGKYYYRRKIETFKK